MSINKLTDWLILAFLIVKHIWLVTTFRLANLTSPTSNWHLEKTMATLNLSESADGIIDILH